MSDPLHASVADIGDSRPVVVISDWPHDLSGGTNIRQPFADVAMCLSMVWCESQRTLLSTQPLTPCRQT